jgi:hypothetical protein
MNDIKKICRGAFIAFEHLVNSLERKMTDDHRVYLTERVAVKLFVVNENLCTEQTKAFVEKCVTWFAKEFPKIMTMLKSWVVTQ